MLLIRELESTKSTVRRAGHAILKIANDSIPSMQKVERTMVTAADLEADRILKESLLGKYKDYGWLSEETKENGNRLNCHRVWIVDPIDGTREFAMHNPEYVVSVALIEDGRPVLGVIYNPETEELFEAVLGEGAKLNGQVITSSHVLKDRPVVEVSRSDIEKGRFIEYSSWMELRPCGSIAYKLARLASGKADSTLSVTPKNEWDIAAGVLLVHESGGKVTDLTGEPYVFNQIDTLVNGVIATTVESYDNIKEIVDSVINN